eukprot:SAG25_NODE_68_length_17436_cov_79.923055_6_plen_119_part_00
MDSGTGAVPVPVVAVPPLLGQAGEDASAATAAVPSPLGQERASREAAGGVDGSVGAVPAFCPVDELIWWYSERDGVQLPVIAFLGYGITNGYWIGSTRYVFEDMCHALLYLYIYTERY